MVNGTESSFSLRPFILRLGTAALWLGLAACSDSDLALPKVFGTEVPEETLKAPRVVPVPPQTQSDSSDWPLLGKVPSKPKDFTPQPMIDAAKSQMKGDWSHAQRLEEDYQSGVADK